MKNNTAFLISFVFVALLFSSCSATGNAAEPFADNKYTCAGNLQLGNNELTISGKNIYYTFEPEKDGVYSLSAGLVNTYKNTDDITSNEPLFSLFAWSAEDETSEFKNLYYFKSAETVFITYDYHGDNSPSLIIEYLGENEDVKNDSDSLKIMGSDVCYDDESDKYLIVGTFTMSFSGTAVKYESGEIYTDSEIVRGENTVEINLLGKSFYLNLNVYGIEDFVAGIRLPEEFRKKGTRTYDGEIIPAYPEYVIVEYTDGRTVKSGDALHDYYIELPDGQAIGGYLYYDENEHLLFEIADKTYDFGPNCKKANFFQNVGCLINNLRGIVVKSSAEIVFSVSVESKNFFRALIDVIRRIPSAVSEEYIAFFLGI